MSPALLHLPAMLRCSNRARESVIAIGAGTLFAALLVTEIVFLNLVL